MLSILALVHKSERCNSFQDKMLNEFLEKHYKSTMSEEQGIKLAVKCLLEVVEHGAKNIDIGILVKGRKLRKMSEEEVNALVEQIQSEEEEDEEKEDQ